MGPDQRVAPVAGSVDINLAAMGIRNDYAAEHVLMLSANFTWGQLFLAGSSREFLHYFRAARCAPPNSRMAAILSWKGCQTSERQVGVRGKSVVVRFILGGRAVIKK